MIKVYSRILICQTRGTVIITPLARVSDSKPRSNSDLPRGHCALALFVKAPFAGESKTRLVPPLTPNEAVALSISFMRDTSDNMSAIASSNGGAGIAVYTPIGAESTFDGIIPDSFNLVPQHGETFGDRLSNAAHDLFALGFESMCLLNSDSPTLPPELLTAAVTALSRPGDRVVLGAAEDGGYYLIGLKQAHRRLFEQIEWSTATVLSQTLQRASEINLEIEVLPSWFDVDDAESLWRLCQEMFEGSSQSSRGNILPAYDAPHTRDYLARLIEKEGRDRIWPRRSASVDSFQ